MYLLPALAFHGLFLLGPLLGVLWLSLQQWNGYGPSTFTGLDNFTALLADPGFQASLLHQTLWEAAALTVPTALALGLALLAARSRGRTLTLSLLFVPALVPPTAVAALWTLLYSPASGPINAALAVLRITGPIWLGDPHTALAALFVAWMWSALGVGTAVLTAALRDIDPEYLDLARVEGAGPWQIFTRIVLPALRLPLLVVLAVNGALAAQVFDLVFVTTGGTPGNATMILSLEEYGRAFGGLGQVGQAAAAATMQMLAGLALVGLVAAAGRHARDQSLTEGTRDSSEPGSRLAAIPPGVVCALSLAPLAYALVLALSGGTAGEPSSTASLDPHTWTGAGFGEVWSAGMGSAMITSLTLALIVAAGTVAAALPAAFALAQLIRSRVARAAALVLLLAGLIQPTPVLVIPLFFWLRDLGLLDTAGGVILPEIARSLPFAVLLLWAAMVALPRAILQATALDGASPLMQLLRVAAPLTLPASLTAAIWAFVTSWNEYLLPTLVFQSGTLHTVPTLLGSFIGVYNTQFGPLAASIVLAATPTLLIYLLLRQPAAGTLRRLGGRTR